MSFFFFLSKLYPKCSVLTHDPKIKNGVYQSQQGTPWNNVLSWLWLLYPTTVSTPYWTPSWQEALPSSQATHRRKEAAHRLSISKSQIGGTSVTCVPPSKTEIVKRITKHVQTQSLSVLHQLLPPLLPHSHCFKPGLPVHRHRSLQPQFWSRPHKPSFPGSRSCSTQTYLKPHVMDAHISAMKDPVPALTDLAV